MILRTRNIFIISTKIKKIQFKLVYVHGSNENFISHLWPLDFETPLTLVMGRNNIEEKER